MRFTLLGIVLFFLFTHSANAKSYLLDVPEKPHSYLLSQAESDDAYDPFTDYSEFDESSEEEADIHFFKNGRFFTFGIVAGMRGFTDKLSSLYGSGPTYGFLLSYFFDLNMAIQFGVITGDYEYSIGFTDSNGSTVSNNGNVSMTLITVNLKYYVNTQNVTKGLADLNPYFIGGISQVYRTLSVSGLDGINRESVVGLDGGAGVEIPLMRRKAYLGLQFMYHFVQFKDENSPAVVVDGGGNQIQTNIRPRGDTYDVLTIIGLNF